MNNSATDLYNKGKTLYDDGKIEEALKCFNTFKENGKNRFDSAVAKRFETSIIEAEPLFQETDSWFRDGENWFRDGETWFQRKISWLDKVIGIGRRDEMNEKLKEAFAEGYYYWGYTLTYLARVKMDEKKNDQAMRLFEEGLVKYDASIELHWGFEDLSYDSKMATFYRMYNISKNNSYKEKAKECLKKTKKDILGILVWLDGDVRDRMADDDFFYDMLDDDSTSDGRFFRASIKRGAVPGTIDVYKNVYVHSIYIISRLYVDTAFETVVAHYRGKETTQRMLFKGESLKLNAVGYSNDPSEGKVLLSYLFGNEIANKSFTRVYGAFAGCFSFNCDSLNQFRLYGKKEKNEGTGLSLVFRKMFFSEKVKLAIAQDEKEYGVKKYTIFRCIYFNPGEERVETVGHKEHNHFGGNGYVRYHNRISRIISDVDAKLKMLKDVVQKQELDPEIVGQLLINLRYLVKDVGFKYEQECRIVKIYHLFDEKDKIKYDESSYKMYIEYEPDVSKHVEKIYFGPKVTGKEMFEDFLVYKGLTIPCERSSGALE